MALSTELRKIYSQNDGRRYYDTIELSHSLFTQTHYFINDPKPQTLTADGITRTFQPFAMSVVLPEKGSNQQDLGLVMDNVAQVGIAELERAAEKVEENIILKYRVYIDGSTDQQAPTIQLELRNVSATTSKITATASRVDLFSRKVPKRIFDPQTFKGIA